MLKAITARSLSELIMELRRRGLSMKDLEGSIHADPSGHMYAIYDTGVPTIIDTTIGDYGVSGYDFGNSGVSAASVTLGAIRTTGSGTLSMSGSAGTATLSSYVIPTSVTITDSGSTAALLVDDGSGVLQEKGTGIRRGTINYYSGAVAVTYPAGKIPSSTVNIGYKYSNYPATTDFPPSCEITKIEISTTSNDAVELSLFDVAFGSADSLSAVQANPKLPTEVLDVTPVQTQAIPTPNSNNLQNDYGYADNFSFASINLDKDPDKQGKRWMNFLSSNTSSTKLQLVLVYWRRVT